MGHLHGAEFLAHTLQGGGQAYDPLRLGPAGTGPGPGHPGYQAAERSGDHPAGQQGHEQAGHQYQTGGQHQAGDESPALSLHNARDVAGARYGDDSRVSAEACPQDR